MENLFTQKSGYVLNKITVCYNYSNLDYLNV